MPINISIVYLFIKTKDVHAHGAIQRCARIGSKMYTSFLYHVFHEFLFAFYVIIVLIKNICFLCFLSYVICVCLCIVVSNTHCVVHFFIVLFVLRLVYLMLPVSLDCPLLISPSVFSNVYILYVTVWIYYVNNREDIFIFYNSYRIHASYCCLITIKDAWNK
jgi:prepilin signal peptidase PulO-like enzyme (type II secretory pathway)